MEIKPYLNMDFFLRSDFPQSCMIFNTKKSTFLETVGYGAQVKYYRLHEQIDFSHYLHVYIIFNCMLYYISFYYLSDNEQRER